jgi:hypothetical protein
MPDTTSQSNKKLSISPCKIDDNGKVTVEENKKFEVMLNPASFKQNQSITYNKQKTLGQGGSDQNFSAVNPKKLDFSIIIDGTGVVTPTGKPDVKMAPVWSPQPANRMSKPRSISSMILFTLIKGIIMNRIM